MPIVQSPATDGPSSGPGSGLVPVAIAGAVVVFILAIFVIAGSRGPGTCKGGVDLDAATFASWTSTDNYHWSATVSCVDGGAKTLHRTGKDPFSQ